MMRNGRIAEHGTHDELMRSDKEYALMVRSTMIDANTDNDFHDEDEPLSQEEDELDGLKLRRRNTKKQYNSEAILEKSNGTGGL